MGDWDYAVEHGFEDPNGHTQMRDYYNDQDCEESIKIVLTPSKHLNSESRYLKAKLVNNGLDNTQVVLEVMHDKLNEHDSLALEVYCNQTFIGHIQKNDAQVNIEEFCFLDGSVLRDLTLEWKEDYFVLTRKTSPSSDSIELPSLAPYKLKSIQKLWKWADQNDLSESEFPRNHDVLIELTELEIHKEDLEYIPHEIGCLKNLVKLTIGSDLIRKIPISIGMLRELNELTILGEQIRTLPSEIGNLEKLTLLSFFGKSLTEIPIEIGRLRNLKQLYIQNTSIVSLPSELSNLRKLINLHIRENKLDSTVDFRWLSELTELENLSLSINDFTSIPEEVFDLHKLKKLSICETKIKTIPEAIGNLSNLIRLDISFNPELKSLPDSIDGLINLVELIAFGTPLETLPESMVNLTNVRFLRFLVGIELPNWYWEWEDRHKISSMSSY